MRIKLMIGLPGSGKTTWVKKFCLEHEKDYKPYIVISGDALRKMVQPHKYRFDIDFFEPIVRKMKNNIIIDCAINNNNIIIDETNLVSNKRLKYFKNILDWIDCPDMFKSVDYIEFVEKDELVLLERRLKSSRGYTPDKWLHVIKELKNIKEDVTEEELQFFTQNNIQFNHIKIGA